MSTNEKWRKAESEIARITQERANRVREVPVSYLASFARGLWLADQLLMTCQAVLAENRQQLPADTIDMLEISTSSKIAAELAETRDHVLCFLIDASHSS